MGRNNYNGYTVWQIEEEQSENVKEYQKKFFDKILKNRKKQKKQEKSRKKQERKMNMKVDRNKEFKDMNIDKAMNEPNPFEKIVDKMAEKVEIQNHCNHLIGISKHGEIELVHKSDLKNQCGITDTIDNRTNNGWGLYLLNYCPYCGKEFDGDKLKELYLHRIRVNAKIDKDKDCFSYDISEKEFEKYYKEVM